ncbi:MAG: hypothetical protein ACE5HS_14045 [bacterium]
MKNLVIGLLVLFWVGCVVAPQVPYSQLQFSRKANPFKSENLGNDYLRSLMVKMAGRQFGDLIFKRNSQVYWILPEIDKVELEIIAEEERISEDEYQSRIKRFADLHEKYLVFALDLRLPFYSKWTQKELDEFIKTNLIVTLENGSGNVYLPDDINFRVIERFQELQLKRSASTAADELEVRIPLRAIFKRVDESGAIVTASTRKISLKLRLRKNPPFRLGFFDDKFFQGFFWKVKFD